MQQQSYKKPWQSNWQVWERFNIDSQISDMWVRRKHLLKATHITEDGSPMVYAEQDNLSVQIVAKILSMKIKILLVKEFTNVYSF